MRKIAFAAPALLLAGMAVAQSDGRRNPMDPQAKVPLVEFHSALEGYRPFADQELGDWRRANEEAAAAGGHAGHRSGQGPGEQTSKPQPGKPAPGRGRHGGHK